MVGENLNNFGSWLQNMSDESLPGAISAAAVSAAMATALVAKSCRVTLERGDKSTPGFDEMHALFMKALKSRDELIQLAHADERAYQSVFDTAELDETDQDRRQALFDATEVPLHLAEICRPLVNQLTTSMGTFLHAVKPDAEVAFEMLEAAEGAGLLIAVDNIRLWKGKLETRSLRARLHKLGETLP